MKRTRAAVAAVCSAVFSATMLIALPLLTAGCGGSGGVTALAPSPTGFLTRATEENFSADAKELTARLVDDAFLPLARAAEIDQDLASIRGAYPAVKGVGAFARFDLRSLLVAARPGSTVATRWKAGEIVTGDASLDAALAQYGPSSVNGGTLVETAERVWFVLHFEQSLNTTAVATALKAASAGIADAQPNYRVGDGNNITLESGADGARTYTFSRGWGDCPSGCTSRHFWKFNVSGDGAVSLVEEGGTPLEASATE